MDKYFFLDDEHVELREHIRRLFHEPVKHGRPVITPETPLEKGRVNAWNTPLRSADGASWRLWYIGGNELLPLYAESGNGLEWRRPELGLVEHGGNRRNNMIDLGFPSDRKQRRLVMALNPSEAVPQNRGDEVDAPVAWRGGKDLAALKGRRVRLMFGLRNAEIFSFWFED